MGKLVLVVASLIASLPALARETCTITATERVPDQNINTGQDLEDVLYYTSTEEDYGPSFCIYRGSCYPAKSFVLSEHCVVTANTGSGGGSDYYPIYTREYAQRIKARVVTVAQVRIAEAEKDPENVFDVVGVSYNDVLNLREHPTANSRITGVIPPNGKDVMWYGQRNGQWVWVEWQSVSGWAHSRYLRPQGEQIDTPDVMCKALWTNRNVIFKAAGLCFKTPSAIQAFGNAGCKYDDVSRVPLTARQRREVAEITAQEQQLGCLN
ncbi:MAG TPA: SH3 domain-containing protein [Microvirga sp.]|nr:SH3 domain-containing protein [Microvirga sp.]